MRSRLVMVVHVAAQHLSKVTFTERDDVIRALPTNRTDDPLDVRVLPGWPVLSAISAVRFRCPTYDARPRGRR